VVVEIWGEISPLGDLVEISKGGMVWRAREWGYGHVSLIEVGEDTPTSVCIDRLSMVAIVVAEIWGEHSQSQ